jgi:GcrA cell cycle regulator
MTGAPAFVPPNVVVFATRKFSATPCCWPIGEPGKPSFHFCNTSSVPGKPYCEDHAAIAYVRIRDRREDAA